MKVLYIDVYLLINFIMNYSLILITGLLTNVKLKYLRALTGALLGAGYSLVLIFPRLYFLKGLVFKAFFAFLIVGTAFKGKINHKLKMFGIFMMVGFSMSGVLLFMAYMGVGDSLFNLPIELILCGVLLGAMLILRLSRALVRKISIARLKTCVKLGLNGRELVLRGFTDTGNHLIEPVSGLPVMIVNEKCLKGEKYEEELHLSCATVNGRGGIPIFKPDYIEIDGALKKGYVGICKEDFAEDYDALINPDLLIMEVQNELDYKNKATVD